MWSENFSKFTEATCFSVLGNKSNALFSCLFAEVHNSERKRNLHEFGCEGKPFYYEIRDNILASEMPVFDLELLEGRTLCVLITFRRQCWIK